MDELVPAARPRRSAGRGRRLCSSAAGVEMREDDGRRDRRARARGGLRGHRLHDRPLPRLRHRPAGAGHGACWRRQPGASAITETMFEQRFRHVDELRKMGANIAVRGRTALVRGVDRLQGAAVTCTTSARPPLLSSPGWQLPARRCSPASIISTEATIAWRRSWRPAARPSPVGPSRARESAARCARSRPRTLCRNARAAISPPTECARRAEEQ